MGFAAVPLDDGEWRVGDGRVIAATFNGELAEVRAREYANARNIGLSNRDEPAGIPGLGGGGNGRFVVAGDHPPETKSVRPRTWLA